MKIKIHTYPQGPASTLPQDEVVSVMNKWGRFNELRIGMLDEGDYYTMPVRSDVTPRTDTELLRTIVDRDLRPIFVDNIMDDSEPTLMLLDKEGSKLWDYDYKKSEYSRLDALRDGVNFILDQEEL